MSHPKKTETKFSWKRPIERVTLKSGIDSTVILRQMRDEESHIPLKSSVDSPINIREERNAY